MLCIVCEILSRECSIKGFEGSNNQMWSKCIFSLFFYPKGRSNKCGGLPDCVATGHGVCGLQHRWIFCCQCVNHGQWPQGPPRSCRCRQVTASEWVRGWVCLCVDVCVCVCFKWNSPLERLRRIYVQGGMCMLVWTPAFFKHLSVSALW